MTIIEAIKSGKAIGRKGHSFYIHQCHSDKTAAHGLFEPTYFLDCVSLTKEDILADDWEIEEKKVEITRDQFIHAFAQAYCCLGNAHKQLDPTLGDAIARILGL
jgi:hypothetical protein